MSRLRTAPSARLTRRALAATALAAAMTLTWGALPAAAGAAPRATAATANVTSGNLIVDPGAESVAQCSTMGLDGMTIPGWTITSGEPDAVCYGAPGGFPDASTPGSPTRGNQFFAGGGTGNSSLSQTADVSAAASAIDAGGVPFSLSGWLGGWSSQNDRVGVTATFQNANGASLGSAGIGPVTNTDRGNTTEFLQRSATGTLPVGTRSIRVDMTFTWTAGNTTDGYADDLSLTVGASVPTPVLAAPPSAVPGYDHVFVVYMENEDYGNIIGNTSQAPYINGLLSSGTVLTQSYATTHPSDPNYMALAAGGLYGLYNNSVSTTTINAPHVGNSVENAGKTWKAYVDGANGNCDYTQHGYYYPDDVPFTYFQQFKADTSATSYCAAHDQPLSRMFTDLGSASTTPNFVWFAADDCNDMESCGISAGDTWLKNTLPSIFSSPAWTTQRSLLILTWDEGATKAFGPSYPNQVPTILLGSQNSVKAGYSSSQRTDQYGLLRTVDKALGLTPLTNNDAYAATVNDAWTGTSGGSGPITSGGVYEVMLGGQAMDDPGSSATSGTQLIVWGLNGGNNQRWTFTDNGDGTYQIKNLSSGLCVDDTGSSNAAGSKIIQWTCTGNANQRWSVAANSTAYELVSKQSGLAITASGTANGSTLTQQASAPGALQNWTFTKVG